MKEGPPPGATILFARCDVCRERLEACESCVAKCRDALAAQLTPEPSYLTTIRFLIATHLGVLGGMSLIVGISRSNFIELASTAWDTANNATKEEG